MKTFAILLICSVPAFAQVGAIREETKTIAPDGSVTFTRKFDPPQSPPTIQYRAPVAAAPTIRYLTVQPEVRYTAAPVYAVTTYAAPVYVEVRRPRRTPIRDFLFGKR